MTDNQKFSDERTGANEPETQCEHCNGLGIMEYNPNLNPDCFEGAAICQCNHCAGTGFKQREIEPIEPDNSDPYEEEFAYMERNNK